MTRAQLTLRKELKRGYPALISYTRSRATSNQTVDFAIDALLVGNQVGGALPWDSPNQLQTWGSYPLPWKLKKFDMAWSSIWRSGFSFVTIDQFGQIVSGPGQFRFPDFFTLNAAVERKFTFHGYRWAARIGMDNILNRRKSHSGGQQRKFADVPDVLWHRPSHAEWTDKVLGEEVKQPKSLINPCTQLIRRLKFTDFVMRRSKTDRASFLKNIQVVG